MRISDLCLIAFVGIGFAAGTQEPSPNSNKVHSDASEIPKGYEVGEKSVSPDGRFAILYPVRDQETNATPDLMNVLVRLKPYAVLQEIGEEPCFQGMRGAPQARWNGSSVVAIWLSQKWGNTDLVIYEIESDKVKRIEKIWPEVVKIFEKDFHDRFLKKYPKEDDSFTFVSDEDSDWGHNLVFKDRKVTLKVFADNKPNLAGGPHWTAALHATWNLDTARFEKVDFKPGMISDRPWLR